MSKKNLEIKKTDKTDITDEVKTDVVKTDKVKTNKVKTTNKADKASEEASKEIKKLNQASPLELILVI